MDTMQLPTFDGTPGKFKVYKFTSNIIPRVYYGSTQNDLGMRFDDHRSSLRYSRHANFQFQLLFNSGIKDWAMHFVDEFDTLEEAREKEHELIKGDNLAINIIGSNVRFKRRNPALNAESIRIVRKMVSEGKKQYEAARAIGSNGCVVSHILNGYHDNRLEATDLSTDDWWSSLKQSVASKFEPLRKNGKYCHFTQEQVEQYAKLRNLGFTRARCAEIFDTDVSTVTYLHWAAKLQNLM